MNNLTRGVLLILLHISLNTFAQWPAKVTRIETGGRDSVIVSGDLASGQLLTDLRWASSSSNACFPATQNHKFMGNHVFFATKMPPHAEMIVSVIPDQDTANLSLYAYMLGESRYDLVPALPSCITCEADHKWDRPWRNRVQTSERSVEFSNPTGNSYNILIGVSAPAGVLAAPFQLKIKIKN